MLVLTRRAGEEISIGPDVTVKVLGVDHGNVRLGIGAPRHVEVWRTEVLARDPQLREAVDQGVALA